MQKEIFEILDLCNSINKIDGLDVSFEYKGHVNGIGVYIKTTNEELQIDEFNHLYHPATIYIEADEYRPKARIKKELRKLKPDLKKILEEHSKSPGLLEFMKETA